VQHTLEAALLQQLGTVPGARPRLAAGLPVANRPRHASQRAGRALLATATTRLFADFADYLIGDEVLMLRSKDFQRYIVTSPTWALVLSYRGTGRLAGLHRGLQHGVVGTTWGERAQRLPAGSMSLT
jgi:hypothetical protein